jgi:hypothetical protein
MTRIFDAGHCNGFYFDEKNNIIYVAVRDLSRIIKVDRSTGDILANYGEKFPSGEAKYANGFFKYMHSPKLLPGGDILVFNNNMSGDKSPKKTVASVVIFTQPKSKNDTCHKKWEFKCDFDKLYNSFSYGSGNVDYFDNQDILVNMGDPVSRIFEVTPDKKVIWDCYPEMYTTFYSTWVPAFNYRVSYTRSLYPVYFTLTNSFNMDTIHFKKNLHLTFNVNNEGSRPDSYLIKYFINDKELKTLETENILPNSSEPVDFNFKNIDIENKKLLIIVNSKSNKKLVRKLNFYID